MTTELTKFASMIRNASTMKAHERHELADAISAAAPSMEIADLKTLNRALTDLIQADAARNSAKSKRLARLQSAMASQADDPLTDSKVAACRSELRRLGFGDINAHAQNGVDVRDLDQRMKAEKWSDQRRIALKVALAHIGLVD
jgi:hypothetical protein